MIQPFRVGSRGNLWYDTAKCGMKRHLPLDFRRQYLRQSRPMPHHGGGGVVAARLDPKEGQCLAHHPRRLPKARPAGNTKPMAPQSFLLTRPAAQSARFADALCARFGADSRIVIAPLMAPVFLHPALPDIPFGALILTSETGAEAARRLSAEGIPLPIHAYCVGDRTAACAAAAGFMPFSAKGDANGLLTLIRQSAPQGPLLYLRGTDSRGDVAKTLILAGIETCQAIVYTQIAQPLTPAAAALLARTDPVIVPLFSPRSARLLAALGPFKAPLCVGALSPAVASAAAILSPATMVTAAHPDAANMLDALDTLLAAGGNP